MNLQLESGGRRSSCSGEYALHFLRCDANETANNVAIELRAAVFVKPADCFLDGKASAIRAIRDHGVECVNHGDDPGAHGDFVCRQTCRIAGPIETLVVMQNEETYLFESRKEPKNSPAKFRMLLHQVIFSVS